MLFLLALIVVKSKSVLIFELVNASLVSFLWTVRTARDTYRLQVAPGTWTAIREFWYRSCTVYSVRCVLYIHYTVSCMLLLADVEKPSDQAFEANMNHAVFALCASYIHPITYQSLGSCNLDSC